MRASKAIQKVPIGGEDIRRWLVFTSFWGSVFYVLSCVSLIIGSRRQTVKFHAPSVGIGYGLHVSTFVVGGSLLSAANSIVRGKSTSEQAEELIGRGERLLGSIGALRIGGYEPESRQQHHGASSYH